MGNQEELVFLRLEGARKYLEWIGDGSALVTGTRRSLVLEGLMLVGGEEDKQTHL